MEPTYKLSVPPPISQPVHLDSLHACKIHCIHSLNKYRYVRSRSIDFYQRNVYLNLHYIYQRNRVENWFKSVATMLNSRTRYQVLYKAAANYFIFPFGGL